MYQIKICRYLKVDVHLFYQKQNNMNNVINENDLYLRHLEEGNTVYLYRSWSGQCIPFFYQPKSLIISFRIKLKYPKWAQ